MNEAKTGADVLVTALADEGVEICFANPGTSEMHLVAALARQPRIRSVLCLFEGVATGAADGFARISGKPAMTLLHLGPGYSNGAANIHNARRAFSPMINVVGDHATTHVGLDAPLTSDIASLAGTSSVYVATATKQTSLEELAQATYAASMSGARGPATMIVPADCAWEPALDGSGDLKFQVPAVQLDLVGTRAVATAIKQARSPAILLGSEATACPVALETAGRIAASGVTMYADTFLARHLRGESRFAPIRIPYFAEDACATLSKHDLIIMAGTREPVAFFAYPDRPSKLLPETATVLALFARGACAREHLDLLATELHAGLHGDSTPASVDVSQRPEGALTPASVGISLARLMAPDTIISDDGVTASGPVYAATAHTAQHDWLSLTGGAIGQGLPVAIGASLARPGARVIALTGDGAAMYTPQALWTMAREKLDITVIVFANRAYRILEIEYQRTKSGDISSGTSLFELDNPPIDWCAMAKAHDVLATACDTANEFELALAESLATPGPTLIEARVI